MFLKLTYIIAYTYLRVCFRFLEGWHYWKDNVLQYITYITSNKTLIMLVSLY